MIIYKHRANLLTDPLKYTAVEVDVKINNRQVVIGHNADHVDCLFEDYLKNCNENTELAINVKESGMVKKLCELMSKVKVKSYFFFDMAVPDLLDYISFCPQHTAYRISEYETRLFDADWIWLDYFTFTTELKNEFLGKKVVVVSPELHGFRHRYKLDFSYYGVCTDDI